MTIALTITIFLLIICFLIIRNLLLKNEKCEDIINNYSNYITKFDEIITFTDTQLKEIDSKGAFASDDEVGFFFLKIKELQKILNQFKIEKR